MIVVIVIIGIGASIAVPNFARMIQRHEWRGYIQTAQNAENALMALTGMQYAMGSEGGDAGNPAFVDAWDTPVSNGGRQFVSIIYPVNSLAGDVFQVNVARVSSGRSAGEQEFYKRTMIDITQPSWNGGPVCVLYCDSDGILSGNYVRYDLIYSVYYMVSNGRNLAVIHGLEQTSTGGTISWTPSPDSWAIFEVNGETYTPYGSL